MLFQQPRVIMLSEPSIRATTAATALDVASRLSSTAGTTLAVASTVCTTAGTALRRLVARHIFSRLNFFRLSCLGPFLLSLGAVVAFEVLPAVRDSSLQQAL